MDMMINFHKVQKERMDKLEDVVGRLLLERPFEKAIKADVS